MARKREALPIERVTVLLVEGDLKRLGELFPKLGASKVIRYLVHDLIRKMDEAMAQAAPPPSIPEDLE